MKRKYIPVAESFERWREEPEFMQMYDALEAEFARAAARIEARSRKGFPLKENDDP